MQSDQLQKPIVNKGHIMKSRFLFSHSALLASALSVSAASIYGAPPPSDGYTELSILSDISGTRYQDPNLLNPWGMIVSRHGLWINDNHTGLTTTYNALGKPGKHVVTLPAPGSNSGGAATGLAVNDTGQFVVSHSGGSMPATLVMGTEDGTLLAWNGRVTGSSAVIAADNSASGAICKGLAIALDASGVPHIYAANFGQGRIDEFDGSFHFVQSFTDDQLPVLPDVQGQPQRYSPFNVETIRGRLFVTFAARVGDSDDDAPGPGNGIVDIFDTDGTLLRRFAEGGALNSPWGMAVAPRNFGKFSHALLVGNFGDGIINAYDLLTGKLLGHLTAADGSDIVIEGLWALAFNKNEREGHESDYKADRLYFTAGPNDEEDGLVGILRPVSPSFPQAH